MHAFATAYAAGAQDALLKFAATRAHKEIWKSMRGGDMDRAHRLSTMPGLLSNSPQAQQLGHQLKDLGRGGEGLASAVAHPTHGAVARKIYDPTGAVYSPQIIRRKEQLGPVANTAKFLGKSETRQGTPIHFNEFVPGQQVDKAMMAHPPFAQRFEQAKQETMRAGRAQGRELRDLRPANAMRTPDGGVKFIDHMPFNRDEVLHPAHEQHLRNRGVMPSNMLPGNDKGIDLFSNAGDRRPGVTNNEFKQHMLGGKNVNGTRSSDYSALNSHVPAPSAAPGPLQTIAPHPTYGQPAPQTSQAPSSSGSSLFPSWPSPSAPTQTPLANAPTQPSVQPPTAVSRKRSA